MIVIDNWLWWLSLIVGYDDCHWHRTWNFCRWSVALLQNSHIWSFFNSSIEWYLGIPTCTHKHCMLHQKSIACHWVMHCKHDVQNNFAQVKSYALYHMIFASRLLSDTGCGRSETLPQTPGQWPIHPRRWRCFHRPVEDWGQGWAVCLLEAFSEPCGRLNGPLKRGCWVLGCGLVDPLNILVLSLEACRLHPSYPSCWAANQCDHPMTGVKRFAVPASEHFQPFSTTNLDEASPKSSAGAASTNDPINQ